MILLTYYYMANLPCRAMLPYPPGLFMPTCPYACLLQESHQFFAGIDFHALLRKETAAPYRPVEMTVFYALAALFVVVVVVVVVVFAVVGFVSNNGSIATHVAS